MDTSDSECFESADEDLYVDDEDTKLSSQIVNTNVSEVNKKLDSLNLTAVEDVNFVESETKLSVMKDKCEIENKSTDESTQLTTEISKAEKSSSKIVNEQILENKKASLSGETHSKPSQSEDIKSSKTDSEKLERQNSKSSVNEPDDELNMWENDDWEPVEPNNKENSSKKINSRITKLVETGNDKGNILTKKQSKAEEENDNSWDNEDWEPVTDDKVLKNKTNDNMWDNDEWESFESVETHKPKTQPENSWSGWGTWGVSSILNTASQGVSTLTNQVSQGLSTVLESGIGIPDPKELAKQDTEIEKNIESHYDTNVNKPNLGFGFGNLSNFVTGVSHITKFVENTGTKVITGGLDTLETIGKKTMEVLQEGDPGLKNKRALLKLDKEKPILSQVLREAKEKSEKENKVLEDVHSKRKLNYEILFDDYQGLVHLEALEMVSKQCDIKLQTLSETSSLQELKELQETMDQIKELCELPDEEDDDELSSFDNIKEKIQTSVEDIKVPINYDKLISTWEETEYWLNNLKLEFCSEAEIHEVALKTLAQLTAIAVEQFHKCGEFLLIKEHRSTANEADSLVQLTMAVTALIGLVAGKFSEKLNMKTSYSESKERINELITNVFFEAGNSSSYVQDAFQLLVPVLQVGAV